MICSLLLDQVSHPLHFSSLLRSARIIPISHSIDSTICYRLFIYSSRIFQLCTLCFLLLCASVFVHFRVSKFQTTSFHYDYLLFLLSDTDQRNSALLLFNNELRDEKNLNIQEYLWVSFHKFDSWLSALHSLILFHSHLLSTWVSLLSKLSFFTEFFLFFLQHLLIYFSTYQFNLTYSLVFILRLLQISGVNKLEFNFFRSLETSPRRKSEEWCSKWLLIPYPDCITNLIDLVMNWLVSVILILFFFQRIQNSQGIDNDLKEMRIRKDW